MEYNLLDISDRTVSFNFSNKIDQKINSKIVELSYEINRILDQLNIVSCYPTYNSLIIDYDPLNIERDKLRKEISEIIENFDFKDLNSDAIFEIDVNYGGNYGEDLKSVSEFTKLSEKDVITIMRRNLRLSSFKLWRKRVSGRKTKHRINHGKNTHRFKSKNQI